MVALPPQAEFDEGRRLAALHALRLLDTAPEKEFDALTALAAELLDSPSAMLTLIDRDRQWVKSGTDAPFSETAREAAFCDHTIRQRSLMVVPDAHVDPRFRDNPLVRDHQLRFYAGLPIHATDADGVAQPIGALCVIDHAPRTLTPAGERALRHLATLAEALIAARGAALEALRVAEESDRNAQAATRRGRLLMHAERIANIGSWRLDLATQSIHWSDNVFRIHDLPVGTAPSLEEALGFFPPHERQRVRDEFTRLAEGVEMIDFEVDFVTATGRSRRVRSRGELERKNGRPRAVIGVFQDVTEHHELEEALRRSADHDPLTGLCNRAAFDRILDTNIAAARDGAPLLLALIDLDNFKTVNDTLGHLAGDEVLKAMAERLAEPWLGGSVAVRLGGDEFALIVTDPLLANDAALASRLQEHLHVSVEHDGLTIATAGSVGIAQYRQGDNSRDLVHRADTLLYAAKRRRVGERRRLDRRAPAYA